MSHTDDQAVEDLIARIGNAAAHIIGAGMDTAMASFRERGLICEGPLTVQYATLFAVTRLLEALARELVATDTDVPRVQRQCAALLQVLEGALTPHPQVH